MATGNIIDKRCTILGQSLTLSNYAVAGKNIIINGAMEIAQRGTSFTGIAANAYTVDRWQVAVGGSTGVVTASQSTAAPPGFPFSLKIVPTTADTSATAGKTYGIVQQVEASNLAFSGYGTSSAVTMTVSFWVYSAQTGTYAFSLRNYAGTRSYVTTYSIANANTWTKIILTIPGDTGGTWVTSGNAGAMGVTLDLGTGTTYRTSTLNAWQTGNYFSTSGCVNVMSSTSNNFQMTGFQMEAGSNASTFSRAGGTLAGETELCFRYFYLAGGTAFCMFGAGVYSSVTPCAYIAFQFPVRMRAAPTLTNTPTAANFGVITGATLTISSIVLTDATTDTTFIQVNATGGTNGQACILQAGNTAAAVLWLYAEL